MEDDNFPNAEADIVMLPPENACGNITDEDSGDEDYVHPNNLPATQLRAPAELNPRTQCHSDSEFESEDEIPLAELFRKDKRRHRKVTSCQWIASDFETPTADEWPRETTDSFKLTTALDLFEKFFDDTLINILVEETNR